MGLSTKRNRWEHPYDPAVDNANKHLLASFDSDEIASITSVLHSNPILGTRVTKESQT
jgi:hypothetical protein